MIGSVARRYAKAVFALAQEAQALDFTGAELDRLATLAADPALAPMLANPLLSPAARRTIAQTLAEQLGLRPLTRNLLLLLADQQRLDHLAGIAAHYRRRLDDTFGRVRATIVSATALSAAQQAQLTDTLAQASGKQVLVTARVDPALLGGVVVDMDGTVYDGSVRTQLVRLARQVAGGRAI
jgi:F-type H+-transporting ATPase subunit delta